MSTERECVCVCVCLLREREREREEEGDRARENETDGERERERERDREIERERESIWKERKTEIKVDERKTVQMLVTRDGEKKRRRQRALPACTYIVIYSNIKLLLPSPLSLSLNLSI